MTNEEFSRILVALNQMAGVNLTNMGGYHVRLEGVLSIIYSQLHREDQAHWRYDQGTKVWTFVEG